MPTNHSNVTACDEWDGRFLLELASTIARRLADDPPPPDSPVGRAAHQWASTIAQRWA
jgi:hypothetical protein